MIIVHTYECKDSGKHRKNRPNNIIIIWTGNCYALAGDVQVTAKTWKTFKGIQNYVERTYPEYELVY